MKKMNEMLNGISSNKKAKWIYRYAVYGCFLAASLFWCIYCIVTLVQLNSMTSDVKFIDTTIDNFLEAQSILERIDLFEGLLIWAIVIAILFILGLVAMILYQVKWAAMLDASKAKRAQEREERAKAEAEARAFAEAQAQAFAASQQQAFAVSQAVDNTAAQRGVFCPFCGTKYDTMPKFCGVCGNKIIE